MHTLFHFSLDRQLMYTTNGEHESPYHYAITQKSYEIKTQNRVLVDLRQLSQNNQSTHHSGEGTHPSHGHDFLGSAPNSGNSGGSLITTSGICGRRRRGWCESRGGDGGGSVDGGRSDWRCVSRGSSDWRCVIGRSDGGSDTSTPSAV
jgi:hypothetical protein